MGVAPPSLAREITVTVAVAVVALAVVALTGVAFIDSSNGIHIVLRGTARDGSLTARDGASAAAMD